MIDYSILPLIEKPARYIGGEPNICIKDPAIVKIRVALAFPDVYEIGESNLALKILYHILNKKPEIWAERVYTPWKDAEVCLLEKGIPIRTFESGSPLYEFDFLGITLPSELCYTNILTILTLGNIPIYAQGRGRNHPIVLGGGPCASNPEPLADFFDLFVVGDGEEVILEIMDRYLNIKNSLRDRLGIINELACIEGVYSPINFTPSYGADGTIKEISPKEPERSKINRRIITDFNGVDFPDKIPISSICPVHDRIAIEIARGCARGCRFCHAGVIYRPPRERSVERILELANTLITSTGYEEVSLLSLSSGDYSSLDDLVCLLREVDPGVGPLVFSLPSLRPDGLPIEVLRKIREGRKPGLTFALEAGSERLRSVINKGISEEDILKMAEQVFMAGWDMLKFYFMIGLPTESEEDLLEIGRIVVEISTMGRRILRKRPRFNITISPFVPKPHTPFQWVSQDSVELFQEKEEFLRKRLYSMVARTQLKFHDPGRALIEAVLARGDRRVGAVIKKAWDNGARFDQWGESFDIDKWLSAFNSQGLSPSFYAHRVRSLDEILPWVHIDMGVKGGFLKQEYERALSGELTPDCRIAGCHGCGACTDHMRPGVERVWLKGLGSKKGGGMEYISPYKKPELGLGETKMRVRIGFEKVGGAVFLSHLDLLRIIIISLRRANIPLCYSQGFHPTPKISFGPALPVGMEGRGEYFDIFLADMIEPMDILERVNPYLPQGIRMTDIKLIPIKSSSLAVYVNEAHYSITLPLEVIDIFGGIPAFRDKVNDIINKQHLIITRESKNSSRQIDIRPFILGFDVDKGKGGIELHMKLKITPSQNLRPIEVLGAICGDRMKLNANHHIKIVRNGLFHSCEE